MIQNNMCITARDGTGNFFFFITYEFMTSFLMNELRVSSIKSLNFWEKPITNSQSSR